MNSMTGFGRAEGVFEGKKISIDIKSLNSKSFDLNIKVPLRYKEKEFEIHRKINEDVSMTWRKPYPQEHEIGLPREKMDQVLRSKKNEDSELKRSSF